VTNLDGVPEEVAEAGSAYGGEAVAEATEFTEPEQTQYDLLELDDDLLQKHVPIKQDGEEKFVTLQEMRDGYNANSVATQRFQEAKEMREQAEEALRLRQAFQANPGLTVQVLAQQQGMTVEQFLNLTPQQQAFAAEAASEEPEYLDPLEEKVAMLEQQLAAQFQREQEREADIRLQAAVGELKQQYQATEEQVRAVVTKAIEIGAGIEAFPMIYQSLAYQMQTQAHAQHSASAEAEQRARQAAAAAAANTVTATGGVQTGGQIAAEPKRPSTPREAVEQAMESVGWN